MRVRHIHMHICAYGYMQIRFLIHIHPDRLAPTMPSPEGVHASSHDHKGNQRETKGNSKGNQEKKSRGNQRECREKPKRSQRERKRREPEGKHTEEPEGHHMENHMTSHFREKQLYNTAQGGWRGGGSHHLTQYYIVLSGRYWFPAVSLDN